MKCLPSQILVCGMLLSGTLFSQVTTAAPIDPKDIGELVKRGTIKFDPTRRVTVTLSEGQTYTVDPVSTGISGQRFAAIPQSPPTVTAAAAGGVPRPPPPPLPPRPWPPLPSPDHGGKPPPKPPGPGIPRPTPPKPKSLIQQDAEAGMIVGRLQTDGINGPDGSLTPGSYTIALTTYEGKAIAVLVDSEGKYVLSSTNFFLLD